MTETKTDNKVANVSIVIPTVKNLTMKLTEILAAVERVPKNGWNDNQKYKFATESDISDCIRAELASRGIFVWSTVRDLSRRDAPTRSGTQTITTVWVDYTFEDAETGEEKKVSYPGEGADGGDKGIYKAMTGALKYMLLKNFLMSSGD